MIIDHKHIDLDFPSALDKVDTQFSSDEISLVDRVFATAGLPVGQDILPGEQAVHVFQGTGLGHDTLKEIWQIANVENKGLYLTRVGVAIAIRLMGWAQNGTPVSEELVERPGPLVNIANLQPAPPSLFTPTGMEPTLAPTQEDIEKYTRIFNSCTLTADNLVEGDTVNSLFLKSQLPVTQLFAIWELADTKSRGSLDLNEFCIAMHLIRLSMEHKIVSIPSSLPLELSCLLHGGTSPTEPEEPPPLPPKPPRITIETSNPPTYDDDSSSPPQPSPRPSTAPPKPRRPPPRIPARPSSDDSIHRPTQLEDNHHGRSRSTSAAATLSQARPVTSYEPFASGSSDTLEPPSVPHRRSISVGPNSLSTAARSITSSSSSDTNLVQRISPLSQPSSSLSSLSLSSSRIVDGLPFDSEWKITETDEAIANHYFSRLDIGKRGWLSKSVVDTVLVRTDLSPEDLKSLWRLIDPQETGSLSNSAFIAMMTIVRMRIAGHPIPSVLPNALKIFDLSQAGSSSSHRMDDSRLSFWISPTKSPEEEMIHNLQTKLDAMQGKIEELQNSAHSPHVSRSPSLVGQTPKLFSPESTVGRVDKGKGRMAWCEDEIGTEDSTLRLDSDSRSSSSLFGKRKGSSSKLRGKLQRPHPLEKENELLKAKIDDWMLSMNHKDRVNDVLLKDKDDLDQQLAELMAANKEASKKAKSNEKLKKQIGMMREELNMWKTRAKQAADHLTSTSGAFEQERRGMAKRVRDAEESMARVLIAGGDRELGRMIKEGKRKDPQFRMTMSDLENHVARVRFDSADVIATDSATQRIQADLTKENEELRQKMQEMEETFVMLQSAEASNVSQPDLHQLVEDLTRENDRIRSEMAALNSSADELARLEAEHRQVTGENERLQRRVRELETRIRQTNADNAPPPAYQEVVRTPILG